MHWLQALALSFSRRRYKKGILATKHAPTIGDPYVLVADCEKDVNVTTLEF